MQTIEELKEKHKMFVDLLEGDMLSLKGRMHIEEELEKLEAEMGKLDPSFLNSKYKVVLEVSTPVFEYVVSVVARNPEDAKEIAFNNFEDIRWGELTPYQISKVDVVLPGTVVSHLDQLERGYYEVLSIEEVEGD